MVFTLCRGSVVAGVARVHIATLDAEASRQCDMDNCDIARDIFQAHPGDFVWYWCEEGYSRP